MAVSDGRLLVAGRSVSDAGNRLPRMLAAALDLGTPAELWRYVSDSAVEVNRTQLTANREWIPFLAISERDEDTLNLRDVRLALLSSADGKVVESRDIREHVERRTPYECLPWIIATPTRIVVQCAGTVVAFGAAPLERAK